VLAGASLFFDEVAGPCRLDYVVRLDASWNTLGAIVSGLIGDRIERVVLAVQPGGRWRMNGIEVSAVAGALDVDLEWTPATNLLPIRRLALPVGGEAPVRAAWLRFPSLELEPLEQVYRHVTEWTYRYESHGGSFTADLEVDDAGFVNRYPGLCERVDAAR